MGHSKRLRLSPREVAKRVADLVHLSELEVRDVLWALAYVIVEGIAEGRAVQLEGIGTITYVRLPGTRVRSPATKELIDIPPRRIPKLRAAKALKEAVKRLDRKIKPIDVKKRFGLEEKEESDGEVRS